MRRHAETGKSASSMENKEITALRTKTEHNAYGTQFHFP